MTDRAQFEAMLEALINDDQQAAKEIFHNIVVGKSREIYEELLAEDFSQDTGNPYSKKSEGMEEEEEESMEEEDMGMEDDMGMEEEDMDMEEEGEEEEGEEEEEDGEDDMEFGGDDGEEGGDIEDRVMDLEDALEDLKAEFEQLMADEENEPAHHDGMDDPDFGGDMGADLETELMEYVIPVKDGHGAERTGGKPTGRNVGAETGANSREGEEYTKSTLRGDMVNNMGGTTANIARNDVAVHGDAGTKNGGGTQGGLLKPSTSPMNAGNVNVPGNKKAPAYKTNSEGHGAEKKGSKPGKMAGAGTGGLDGQHGEQNTQSTLRQVPKAGKSTR